MRSAWSFATPLGDLDGNRREAPDAPARVPSRGAADPEPLDALPKFLEHDGKLEARHMRSQADVWAEAEREMTVVRAIPEPSPRPECGM